MSELLWQTNIGPEDKAVGDAEVAGRRPGNEDFTNDENSSDEDLSEDSSDGVESNGVHVESDDSLSDRCHFMRVPRDIKVSIPLRRVSCAKREAIKLQPDIVKIEDADILSWLASVVGHIANKYLCITETPMID